MKNFFENFAVIFVIFASSPHHKFASNALPLVLSPQHRTLFGSSSGRVESPRLSVAEWNQYSERDVQGPDTYAFGYDVEDPETDSTHFRHEERLPNGTVVGSYGFVTPDGNAHVVKYIADHLGYRATVETAKRLADVKPIVVNVEQDLADEISTAELALEHEENHYGNHVPVAVFDYDKGKYVTKPTDKSKTRNIFVNNNKQETYQVKGNLATRSHVSGQYNPVAAASVQQPSVILNPPHYFY